MRSLPLLTVARLWAWALVLRPLKHVVPLGTLVRRVHGVPRRRGSGRFEEELEAWLEARGRFPRRAPANCLERSLAAYHLLTTAGARPEIIVGVRRSGDAVEGHVWVTLDGRPLAESPEFLEQFAPVIVYDADGRERPQRSGADLDGVRLA